MTTSSGFILVIDDEPNIVDVAVRCLSQKGYRAIGATTAQEAIQLFTRYHAEITLVIADMIMPEILGDQLFNQFREFKQGTGVLYMSGNLPEALYSEVVLQEGVNFLGKPFSIRELMAAVETSIRTSRGIGGGPVSERPTN